MAWLRCWIRGHHNPARSLLGGFRCADCGFAGEDLDDMGFKGGGYVSRLRSTFSRSKTGGVTREPWTRDDDDEERGAAADDVVTGAHNPSGDVVAGARSEVRPESEGPPAWDEASLGTRRRAR